MYQGAGKRLGQCKNEDHELISPKSEGGCQCLYKYCRERHKRKSSYNFYFRSNRQSKNVALAKLLCYYRPGQGDNTRTEKNEKKIPCDGDEILGPKR